jgi:DNA-binding NarL/FixJ family response regulator
MVMKRILFVGQGLFCDGLTRLLSDSPSVEVLGTVQSCADAHQVVLRERPDILIVDHIQAALNPLDVSAILESVDSLKVIFLTLAENKMVIHDRRQLGGVTLPDLVEALQLSSLENLPGESIK